MANFFSNDHHQIMTNLNERPQGPAPAATATSKRNGIVEAMLPPVASAAAAG